MQPQILVVSDPPHGDVDYDAVSASIGLDVETTRLKVAFPAPEILVAAGPQRAHEIAEALTGAGLHTRLIPGNDLAEVPWPALASETEFGDDALQATVDGDVVEIPYSAAVWGVACRPPEGLSNEATVSLTRARTTGPGPDVAEALEWTHHVDLYASVGGRVQRVAVADDVAHVVEEAERLFHRIGIDRRLDGVRPRQRFVAGDEGFDIDLRKAFSYGTLLLRQVLQSISEELRDLTQYEYASRLSFATRPGSRAS